MTGADDKLSAQEWAEKMIPPSGGGEVIAANVPFMVAIAYMKLHNLEIASYVNGTLVVRTKRDPMVEMAEELAKVG
jgi:hypothetical protein